MRWDEIVEYDNGDVNIDDRGADTYTCGDCGTVVRDGLGCPECEYGLAQGWDGEEGGEA